MHDTTYALDLFDYTCTDLCAIILLVSIYEYRFTSGYANISGN